MIDFGRASLRLAVAPGVIAVDNELPESSQERDCASLIGNMELLWEHHCNQHEALFPGLKALLRQKYGLPEEDIPEHWMAPLSVCGDSTFSPVTLLARLKV